MTVRTSLLFTSALVACASLAFAEPPPLSGWLSARAAEYRRYLEAPPAPQQGRPTPSGGERRSLWRERAADDVALPDFQAPTSLAPLIRAVRDTVVHIGTENGALGTARRSLGSGFIISPDGYVVTNNHVVEKARSISVTLADGREFSARVVGRDPSTDVALLLLEGTVSALPTAYLGDSDALQIGDWVVAIGNPFGLDHSVSHGMISAKERVIGVGLFDDFIQTDALINPGNSGGPLFNMRGEVIGVNTAIISRGQGIGFAVPINMVKDLVPNLLVNGRLARGWLGVNIQEPSEPAAKSLGAVVKDVFRGSPAATAGLRPGDRVVAVNGRPIDTYLQLLRRVAILAPGSTATFTVRRAASQEEIAVKLSERPAPEALQRLAAGGMDHPLGIVVRELTEEVAANLGLAAFSGVWVAGVVPGGPADAAGLRAGDLITELNRRSVRDVRGFQEALKRTTASQGALVRFQRGDDVRYVAVQPRTR